MAISLTIIGAAFPNGITRKELWSSWDGPLILISGFVMTIIALAVFRQIRLIRYLWPIYFAGMFVHACVARPEQMMEQLLASTAWLLISFWYFFRKQTVVRYFQSAKHQ